MQDRHHFRKLGQFVALSLALVVLAGCTAGQYFVKAKPGDFTLQKSTRSEVFEKMGSRPASYGSMLIDGQMIKSMIYSYQLMGAQPVGLATAAVQQRESAIRSANAQAGDPDPNAVSARSEVFYFLNDVLVGMDYASSFEMDATKLNPDRIAQITKGKSTRSDVIKLLGPAQGLYAQPLIAAPGYRGLVYIYSPVSNTQHETRRKLVVIYDKSGVVTDIKYSAHGQDWAQY